MSPQELLASNAVAVVSIRSPNWPELNLSPIYKSSRSRAELKIVLIDTLDCIYLMSAMLLNCDLLSIWWHIQVSIVLPISPNWYLCHTPSMRVKDVPLSRPFFSTVSLFSFSPARALIHHSFALSQTFGEKLLGVMSWIMPISVALSTFGGVNGSLFTSSRSVSPSIYPSIHPIHSYLVIYM